jgi:hypothetical protein
LVARAVNITGEAEQIVFCGVEIMTDGIWLVPPLIKVAWLTMDAAAFTGTAERFALHDTVELMLAMVTVMVPLFVSSEAGIVKVPESVVPDV